MSGLGGAPAAKPLVVTSSEYDDFGGFDDDDVEEIDLG